MERRLVITSTIILCVLCALFFIVYLVFPNMHQFAINRHNMQLLALGESKSFIYYLRDGVGVNGVDQTQGHNLRLEFPTNVDIDEIEIKKDLVHHVVTFEIPGVDENYLDDFPMVGSSNRISDVIYSNRENMGMLEIYFDSGFDIENMIDDRFMYLDFRRPKDIYDYVVVVDAGHGGKDGGSVKEDINEKDINLSVLLKLKDIFDKEAKKNNIGVYYTREDDSYPNLNERVALANDLNADLFLSIHQNSTSSGRMSDYNGTEVWYKTSDPTEGSKHFAQTCLDNLIGALGSKDNGLIPADEILIIRKAQMPVALCEMGFMTNEEELGKITNEKYQKKEAEALYKSVLEELRIE